jgi:hypothetical protein
MDRKFKELEGKMSPEARARVQARTVQLMEEMALDEARRSRDDAGVAGKTPQREPVRDFEDREPD